MSLERVFQINIGTLVALGSLMLGMNQGSVFRPLLAVAAAFSSIYLTDMRGIVRLSTRLSSITAVIVVAISMSDFFNRPSEYQLNAVANLLVYLQTILLFQQKRIRTYWQLMVLSLLQVVVGAALSLSFQFGFLIVAYMLTILSAAFLFFLHREVLEHTSRYDVGARLLFAERQGTAANKDDEQTGFCQRIDCTSILQQIALSDITKQVIAIGMATLVFALIVFFTLPRFTHGVWNNRRESAGFLVTGLGDGVTLDELANIIQSDEAVMRISFVDQLTGEPYTVKGEPYLRGPALSNYDTTRRDGRWTQNTYSRVGTRLTSSMSSGDFVRQNVVLERTDDVRLPAAYPAYDLLETPSNTVYDLSSQCLSRRRPLQAENIRRYRYVLGTTAFANGRQQKITPEMLDPDPLGKQSLLQFDRAMFPNLAVLAKRIVVDTGVDVNDHRAVAEVLESHFHDSEQYSYSLEFSNLRNVRSQEIDPIEDFISNHRTGHCEYFASALVMMLRSLDIPARLAVGYKGGDFNRVGQYYIVRQLHTHAWVEAYLSPEQFPEYQPGAWLRLDPTPQSIFNKSLIEELRFSDQLQDFSEYCQLVWSEYVLRLNSEQQMQMIYVPLKNYLKNVISLVIEPDRWLKLRRLAMSVAGAVGHNSRNSGGFSWRIGLLVLFCSLVMVGIAQAVGRVSGKLVQSFWAWKAKHTYKVSTVEFYARFELITARHGRRRRLGETPLEFSRSLETWLRTFPETSQVALFPGRIVAAYYRVYFGGLSLGAEQLILLQCQVGQLDRVLANARRQRRIEKKTWTTWP